jgi:hypothetical protein
MRKNLTSLNQLARVVDWFTDFDNLSNSDPMSTIHYSINDIRIDQGEAIGLCNSIISVAYLLQRGSVKAYKFISGEIHMQTQKLVKLEDDILKNKTVPPRVCVSLQLLSNSLLLCSIGFLSTPVVRAYKKAYNLCST